MIVHQTIANERRPVQSVVLPPQLKVHLPMGIAEEYRLTMVAALGNVMRPAGHDYASDSWHHP
jgi:hypothetical protein